MIREIQIKNFKSIDDLTLELGRVNVLIGANGCGKTNILEAICLGGAAAADKLDNEFLKPRGIRKASPREMRSGFSVDDINKPVLINFCSRDDIQFDFELSEQSGGFGEWEAKINIDYIATRGSISTFANLQKLLSVLPPEMRRNPELYSKAGLDTPEMMDRRKKAWALRFLMRFMIYVPDQNSIRRLEEEERTLPLGIDGSGVFRLLQKFSAEQMAEVKTHLRMIDWFDDFEMPDNLIPGERRLRIKDQYIAEGLQFFEQRVANEGFLFLLFYLCLFISEHTPKFFAIDNLDHGFNPKLCAYTAKTLCELAKTHDKQAIITTHNPSVLDGLDLKDDENRLFVVYRNIEGRTRIRRILPKEQPQDEPPLRLSEAFLRGYLGGLPRNF